jgi:hypothetical protein
VSCMEIRGEVSSAGGRRGGVGFVIVKRGVGCCYLPSPAGEKEKKAAVGKKKEGVCLFLGLELIK